MDVASGDVTAIDRGTVSEIRQVSWSPDSRWLAYAKTEPNHFRSIFLYDTQSKQITPVTGDMTDNSSPVFDPEGKWLYFTSARHFQPAFGGYDLRPFWTRQDGIYLVTLKGDAPAPFPPQSDEVAVKGEEGKDEKPKDAKSEKGAKDEKSDKSKDEKSGEKPPKVEIDVVGIRSRIAALPVGPGNYGNLSAAKGKLFFMDRPALPEGDGEDDGGGGGDLKVFLVDKRETKTVLAGVDGFDLSADGQKILYGQKGKWGIVDAAPDQKPAEKPLRTGEMKAKVDPKAEWAQMFREVWRLERDFFYDPGMHGVDWDRMGSRYGQLVPYIGHREDLNYLFGELIGELNCSHTYTGGGDAPRPARLGVGLLGCDFELDKDSGRYRIKHILTERDWNSDDRTPLFGPGINVKEGELLLAVDGAELRAPTSPYALFENKVDKQVVLKIGLSPDGKGSREVTVEPIASEHDLRYTAWVEGNRRKVDELSKGRIGYFHMPNTSIEGVQAFAKGYYPQLVHDALIIDERNNGGGFIPDIFTIELGQKPLNMWARRPGMQSEMTPSTAFNGPMAMLVNGYAGSGGDAFPWYFKHEKLGPVIGKRTWGGLVGIDRNIQLVDGGRITMPAFGFYDMQGKWEVENHGTEPDIDIDTLPDEDFQGHDPQLEKAVQVLMDDLQKNPPRLPQKPAYPRDKAE